MGHHLATNVSKLGGRFIDGTTASFGLSCLRHWLNLDVFIQETFVKPTV